MKTLLYFDEVEHNGDLDNYIKDIEKAGGKVVDKQINYDAETAMVEVEFDKGFAERFKETDAYGFCNLSN